MSFSNLVLATYSTNIIIRNPFTYHVDIPDTNIWREKTLWTLSKFKALYLSGGGHSAEHIHKISVYFNRNILFIYCKQCWLFGSVSTAAQTLQYARVYTFKKHVVFLYSCSYDYNDEDRVQYGALEVERMCQSFNIRFWLKI